MTPQGNIADIDLYPVRVVMVNGLPDISLRARQVGDSPMSPILPFSGMEIHGRQNRRLH